ncbi:MAG: MFS transporter [Oscillospiraceae bacterium]|nr:MFS transporter [Oscillospiraceae bacterium]
METNKMFRRDFIMVLAGQIISLFGNAILRFALPLYLLRETNSASLFGAVTACSFIPMIVFSLFGGVIADRVNKRNIMVGLDFCTAAVICIFYLCLGKLPLVPLMIAVLMILYGISGAYQPSVQASIPLLTDNEVLMKANALVNLVSTLSGLLGPVIGGVLFASFGINPILYISTACFICSAVMEIFIHIPYTAHKEDISAFKIVRSDIRECTDFLKNDKPVFISVISILVLFNLLLSAAMVVGIPIIIVQVLDLSDEYLGFTQGAMGLGGIAGGLLTGIVSSKLRISGNYLLLAVCSAAALIMGLSLFPIVPSIVSYVVITLMVLITMSASTMFSISMLTLVQQQTPSHLLGKIMAVIMAVTSCSQPLGNVLYGLLFDAFIDIPWIIMIFSAVSAFIVSLCSRRIFARLEKETASQEIA